MTNQDIFELLSRFENSCIQMMKLNTGDFSMELSKAAGDASLSAGAASMSKAEKEITVPAIAAPLAGVFYAASEPGAKPYVAVGDRVHKGDTVCLMEAMKMMSEVIAPCDLLILEVLKENGAMAEFGEPLFRYRPC